MLVRIMLIKNSSVVVFKLLQCLNATGVVVATKSVKNLQEPRNTTFILSTEAVP